MSTSVPKPLLTSLTLAAYGWLPANWSQVFYPEDLPADWQVSYYANEFSRVLLPANALALLPPQAATWGAAVGADFGFYLELTQECLQAEYWSQVQSAVEQHLTTRLLGLLIDVDVAPLLPEHWMGRFVVHQRHPGHWLAETPSEAEAQIGVLQSTFPLSPLELRLIFEQMQQQTMHRDVILFLDTPWATLEQIRLMQQLYGI